MNDSLKHDFQQVEWDERLAGECGDIVALARREDLDDLGDLTTVALVPESAQGAAEIVCREPGSVAGLPAIDVVIRGMDTHCRWHPSADDGDRVSAGTVLGRLEGPTRQLLTIERTVLNLVGRLSGIATSTRQYVDRVAGTRARIYDTRKTVPGWRRLDKYAVRCGGGTNHRTGLYDAVLIKDNHLAAFRQTGGSPCDAVMTARQFVTNQPRGRESSPLLIEVEVDTLEQLDLVLPASPDIVLLDNMLPAVLREAVRRRDASGRHIELEASGGITLDTIRGVAKAGVDRISVGAITHSVICLDIGLDWTEANG